MGGGGGDGGVRCGVGGVVDFGGAPFRVLGMSLRWLFVFSGVALGLVVQEEE